MRRHHMRQMFLFIIAGIIVVGIAFAAGAASSNTPQPGCSFETVTPELLNKPNIQTFTSAFVALHGRRPHGGEKSCWTRMFYWKKAQTGQH